MQMRRLRVILAGAAVFTLLFLLSIPAFAQYVGPTPKPTPQASRPPTEVQGRRFPRPARVQVQSEGFERLPVTGADIAGIAVIGLGATAIGAGMWRMGRRRPDAAV
jgi:hypothetical protein